MATAPAGTLLRHVQKLASGYGAQQWSDRQLLEDFTSRRSESAFAALVVRHGPMVLRVCRRVLGHEQDAEDAFQATFLVLARNSAAIHKRDALAAWLHGVAYRTAMKAKRTAARRRRHEAQRQTFAPQAAPSPPWDDAQAVLDEEVQRLPPRFREAFLLCVLEGKGGADVAAALGCRAGTVKSRVSRARRLLQQRLARRGIALSALLAGLSVAEGAGRAALPAALSQSAVRFGLLAAAGEPGAAVIPTHTTALAAGLTRAMSLSKAKVATAVVFVASWFAVGAATLAQQSFLAQEGQPPAVHSGQAPAQKGMTPPAANDTNDVKDGVSFHGRIMGPDSKPVAGAKLYLARAWLGHKAPPSAAVQATSDRDGLFRFRPGTEVFPYLLVATAEGYGPGVAPAEASKDLVLKLARDDVPINGRVVDLQGRPVRGATVRVLHLLTSLTPGADDLTPFLDAVKARRKASRPPEYYPARTVAALRCPEFPTLPQTAITDSDGRFRLTGVGRERVVVALIAGPGIASKEVRIVTRDTAAFHLLEDKEDAEYSLDYHGATFTHVALPTRSVVGVVRDKETRKPLAGVRVQSYRTASQPSTETPLVETVTDAQGRYRLVGMLPQGKGCSNKVVAVAPEDKPYLAASRDVGVANGLEDVTVDFELKRGTWLAGKVVDQRTGKPLRCYVAYNVFEDNRHHQDPFALYVSRTVTMTGDDGTFRLLILPGRGLIGAGVEDDRYCFGEGADRVAGLDRMSGRFLTYPSRVAPRDFHTLLEVRPAEGVASVGCTIALRRGRTRQIP
jgi:RNA polymerase sigma factor (sigma-70 family)